MENYAVIDLGTNTFHLLIAGPGTEMPFQEVYRERKFVKLGEDGVEKIGAAPFQRGLETLQYFANLIRQYQVTEVKAIGTAALRTASNGLEFIEEAKALTGIQIELIDGQREAELIFKGVQLALSLQNQRILIMDIGGGSVEFIIADHKGMHWAQSFPLGVLVLFNQFHQQDPISSEEIKQLADFLTQQLLPLQQQLQQFPCQLLVGASGTFDVLGNMIGTAPPDSLEIPAQMDQFPNLYQQVIKSTTAERQQIAGIPATRVDLIVVALILINTTLELTKIEQITTVAYAMKEGILSECLKES